MASTMLSAQVESRDFQRRGFTTAIAALSSSDRERTFCVINAYIAILRVSSKDTSALSCRGT